MLTLLLNRMIEWMQTNIAKLNFHRFLSALDVQLGFILMPLQGTKASSA